VREATSRRWARSPGRSLAITLVLSSCFCEAHFWEESPGIFFPAIRADDLASMIISAINAMTMTPARAASIFATRKPVSTAIRVRKHCRGGSSACLAAWPKHYC